MKARLRIQADRIITAVSRKLSGLFLEHHHNCIEDGIYQPSSSFSNAQGFRTDVLEALRNLRPGVVRFPGGNFACDYDWKDGILSFENRPTQINYGTGYLTDYRFGTHEFLEYCRALGAQPMLTTNISTSTPRDAADWVQYCNARDGKWAGLRAANGFPDPWNVPYWCIGNELYGSWNPGSVSGEAYGILARESAMLMKIADPTIHLIGMASGTLNPDWDYAALAATIDIVDMVSLHIYVGRRNFYDCMAGAAAIQYGIDITYGQIEAAACAKRMQRAPKISFDEYNVWYRTRNNLRERLGEIYNLQDALTMASIQHVLYRNADKVGAACLSFPTNTLGAIMTNATGTFLQTIYWPLYFAAQYYRGCVVDCFTNCPTFRATHPRTFPGIVAVDEEGCEHETSEQKALMMEFDNLPYLDVFATHDKNKGSLTLSVVNRHESESITTQLEILGTHVLNLTRAELLTASSPRMENSYEKPQNVSPRSIPLFPVSNAFQHTFPAHSQTILELATC